MGELNDFCRSRTNYYASTYCEIAMESYFEALNYYEKIRESDYLWEMMEEYSQMEKGVIKCIVFSAMCVESFLNDYAAMRMGDSDFYDNFDKLKPIGKFQLIANFILKSEFDKSKSYYSFSLMQKERRHAASNKLLFVSK